MGPTLTRGSDEREPGASFLSMRSPAGMPPSSSSSISRSTRPSFRRTGRSIFTAATGGILVGSRTVAGSPRTTCACEGGLMEKSSLTAPAREQLTPAKQATTVQVLQGCVPLHGNGDRWAGTPGELLIGPTARPSLEPV